LVLGFFANAVTARMTRAQMLEIMRFDYIRTARAKGLHEQQVIIRHALRNALLPVTTIAGLQFGALLSGTVITETIFGLPGLGRLFVSSVFERDYPVLQTITLLFAGLFLALNLLVDLLYGWLDPRIRYQ
jgi:ABC-type dipeptide/oligopeptide/nickel transport system permease component